MPTNSHLSALFVSRPIVLVVEDRVVEEYLYAAWGPERQNFAIVAAGGHDTVKGVVTDAHKHNHTNVFGLRDRDFTADNYATWATMEGHMYVLPRHEVENYLLHWDALEGCDLNYQFSRTSGQIRARAEQEAMTQTWWLACRRHLDSLHVRHTDGFPETPPIVSVTDLPTARNVIAQSPWFQNVEANANATATVTNLDADLGSSHTSYTAQLAADTWVETFSGKEVFTAIRGYIYNFGHKHGVEPDVDLAQSVGKWQAWNNAVPQEVTDLRNALKNRVGV